MAQNGPQLDFNTRYCRVERPIEQKVNDYDEFSAVYDEIMGVDYALIVADEYLPTIERMQKKRGSVRLLDIACGSGAFTRLLGQVLEPSSALHGIDLSKGQIAVAKAQAQGRDLNVTYDIGDVCNMALPECDIATMNLDALNHLPTPAAWQQLFMNVHQALSPKGLFLFDINTQRRLLYDWNYPEIILKPHLSYIQVSSKAFSIDAFVGRQQLMEVYREEPQGIRRYSAVVRQIAPPNDLLFQMLKAAGFSRATERPMAQKQRKRHIFLKNRLFATAEK